MIAAPLAREDESTWTRLRRRKVVQWAVAYAAGAWGFLQGLAYVSTLLDWPAQLQRLTGLALLTGLPIALVLAWYHGDRGEQRVGRAELAILTLLFLLGGGLFWRYQHTSETSAYNPATDAKVAKPAATASADRRPSIAVLPFENRSRLEDDAFFVDGMHDDILTQLTKVGALKVIARTSVEQFRDTRLTTREIGEKLGVTKVLEGGVQRAGNRVRVTVQLIDAATDAHVWAESYDRELTAANIFAIQSEVASAITSALKASLTSDELARVDAIPTRSLDAWRAYQLGRQRMSSRTSAALKEAERYFEKAIALDAKFALARVGLADVLTMQVFYSGRPRDAALDQAETAVTTALELDPRLAEAWASAGNVARSRLQFERAETLLRRAIEINPNFATAYQWLSYTLTGLGRREEALSLAEKAVVLDPLSAIINNWLGAARENVGRFDEALAAYNQTIEIDPNMAIPYVNIGGVYSAGFGRFDLAIPWMEKAASLDSGNVGVLVDLADAYWALGFDEQAGQWLDQALAIGEKSVFTNAVAALLYLDRGDEASAREHALLAAEQDPTYLFLIRDHDLRQGDNVMARARYAKAFPNLFAKELSTFPDRDSFAAIDLALVLQRTGEDVRARELLDRSDDVLGTIPRLGSNGSGLSDVAIHALRGNQALALAALREAERSGFRDSWRYHRDWNPNFASIRNAPEFKAVFDDIERDMARQRAELAARPKDAPLELAELRK